MTEYLVSDTDMKKVADAIRAKSGTTTEMVFPDGFSAAVGAISTAPDTQEKTVPLSMADGDQVVTPDEGKVLAKVTVRKPSTLVPENVKKDVNIGGVVGTLESGGSDTVVYQGNLVAADVTSESIVFAIQEGQLSIGVMSNIAAEASHIFVFSAPGVVPANGYLNKDSPSDSLFIVNAQTVGSPSYEVDTANSAIILNGLSGAGEVQVGSAYFVHYVAPSID